MIVDRARASQIPGHAQATSFVQLRGEDGTSRASSHRCNKLETVQTSLKR